MKVEIHPKGHSMLPFIQPGDSVIIEIGKKDIKKYDVVLYKKGDRSILHRVLDKKGNEYIICGDNEDIYDKVSEEQIIGVAQDCDSTMTKIFVRCWYRLKLKYLARSVKKIINKGKRL